MSFLSDLFGKKKEETSETEREVINRLVAEAGSLYDKNAALSDKYAEQLNQNEKYKADNLSLMSQIPSLQARLVALNDSLVATKLELTERTRLSGLRQAELTSYLASSQSQEIWLQNKLLKTRKELRALKSKKKLTKRPSKG